MGMNNDALARVPVQWLDPYKLPARFSVACNRSGRAGAEFTVTLDEARARFERVIAGRIPVTVNVPLRRYEGVAIRVVVPDDTVLDMGGLEDREEDAPVALRLELCHRDPDLTVPLHVAGSLNELAADWRAWGESLGLPLLMIDAFGVVRAVTAHVGAATIRHGIHGRRARRDHRRFVRRRARRMRNAVPAPDTHFAGAREIIART